jgi:Ca2+-binding RTX toxin-like protein
MGKNVWVTVIYTDTLATVEKVKSKATLPISQSTKSSLADDVLTGKQNADKLTGLAGNDTLIGGLGKDNLTGGIGADIFKFNAVNETASIKKNADVIVDFKTSENDKIDLSAIDANSTLIGNQSFKFIKGNQFDASVIGQVYFNSTDQTLYGTTREDMKPEFAIYLAGVKSMTADDFIL